MFAQLMQKSKEASTDSIKQQVRESIKNMKISHQKLMIYQVLTSRTNLFCQASSIANNLSKKALGVNVNTLCTHPSSNLRAFSFVLIFALTQNFNKTLTHKQVTNKLKCFKENSPLIKNYSFQDKFKQSQMLQIFSAMQVKIMQLIEGGLSLFDIIKVYNCYLQVTSFFLRCVLSNVKFIYAEDSLQRLPTNEVYSILSEYLDLSYIINKNIFLFPDIKIFIATPDDREFIFGKYYQNSEQLKSNQSQIRQSTMQYIQEHNQKYESMKISKINLDVTMSQFLFPQKLSDLPAPFSSKAPTPEFGQMHYNCFEQLIGYSSEQQNNVDKKIKESNQKQTKPESSPKIDDWQCGNNSKFPQKQPNFNKKVYGNQPMNRNIIGSAFYLQQFDFFHKTNNYDGDPSAFDKISSERVLLKGSSMVQKGQLFIHQVGQLKKQIQNKMMEKDWKRAKNGLQESISAHNLGHSKQLKNNKFSPLSHKSNFDNKSKSSQSNISQKKSKKMQINSEVYNINIIKHRKQIKVKPRMHAAESRSRQRSISNKSKISCQKQEKVKPVSPVSIGDSLKFNQKLHNQKKSYRKGQLISKISTQFGNKSQKFQNHNHNHIHIHIHNDNNKPGNLEDPEKICQIRSPQKKEIHYRVDEKNVQTVLQNSIPEIIKQMESQSNHSNQSRKSQLNQQLKKNQALHFSHRIVQNNTVIKNHTSPHLIESVAYNKDNIKLRKRKSQDGCQIILNQANRQAKLSQKIAPYTFHVPSFLRNKKQKQSTVNLADLEQNKSKERQRKSPLSITFKQKVLDSHKNMKSKQKPTFDGKRSGEKLNLKLKQAKHLIKCSVDLSTPTFGAPLSIKDQFSK